MGKGEDDTSSSCLHPQEKGQQPLTMSLYSRTSSAIDQSMFRRVVECESEESINSPISIHWLTQPVVTRVEQARSWTFEPALAKSLRCCDKFRGSTTTTQAGRLPTTRTTRTRTSPSSCTDTTTTPRNKTKRRQQGCSYRRYKTRWQRERNDIMCVFPTVPPNSRDFPTPSKTCCAGTYSRA